MNSRPRRGPTAETIGGGQNKRWMVAAGILVLVAAVITAVMSDDSSRVPVERVESLDGVAILPELPTGQQELRVSQRASLAAMNSTLDATRPPEWVWSVNGKEVARGESLDPDLFRRGDLVEVRLDEGSGIASPSASVVIQNSAPRILGARIVRDEVDPLQLKALVEVDDPDGDAVITHVQWLLDGKPVRRATERQFPVGDIGRGQELQIDVTVSDGDLEVRHISTPFEIQNRPPSLDVAASPVLMDDEQGGKIAVLSLQTSDEDGDEVRIEVEGEAVMYDPERSALVWQVVDGSEMFDVRIRAVDESGASASRSLTLRR